MNHILDIGVNDYHTWINFAKSLACFNDSDDKLNKKLAEYNGKVYIDNRNYKYNFVEFKSEADLVYFKLVFG